MYKHLIVVATTLFLFACSSDNTVEDDLNSTSTESSVAIPAESIMVTEPKTTAEEILSKNQTDLDKIKLQKREWYYQNRKSVLKQ